MNPDQSTPPLSPNDASGFQLVMGICLVLACALLLGAFVFADDHGGSLGGGLAIDDSEISVLDGGAAHMTIDLGPAVAGYVYVVIGTIAGTRPGFDYNTIPIPLNYDGDGGYMNQTILHPNAAPLSNSLGALDANGQAVVTFTVPPESDPGFAGLTVSHVATLWFVRGQSVMIASTNAVDLELVR